MRIEISGTALFSDLLAKVTRDEYNTLVGLGISFEDAEELLIDSFPKLKMFIPEHESVFWLALAYTEHKYGAMSELARDKALHAIDSGEDLKKWENAALWEPYQSYIWDVETEESQYQRILGFAAKKMGETPADPTEEGFQQMQVNLIMRFVREYPKYKKMLPSSLSGKKPVPVPKPEGEPDPFMGEIRRINGSCEKKLEQRREVLRQTREYLTTPQPPKKPKKVTGEPCPWQAGDVVACRTHSAGMSTVDKKMEEMYLREHGEPANFRYYENGKIVLLLILKVVREPVSNLVPAELVSNDHAIVAYYDYWGDEIPAKEELAEIPFLKWNGPFGSVHTAVNLYFYNSKRFLAKTEWTVVDHFEGYPDNIPEFFRGTVMGSSIQNFGDEVFSFIDRQHRKGVET